MKVAIRTDAGSRIGSGHVMRCRTLADEPRRRGADVRFVCREQPGHLIALLSGASYSVAVLPPLRDVDGSGDADETIAALNGFAPDWLVVDHYGLDEEWESRLRCHVGRILVIDDLVNRRHACDVLLDQNSFTIETQHRCHDLAPGAECLLGPRYALLEPAFRRTRRRMPPRDGCIRRLLIFFGAVDSTNQTVKALRALQVPGLEDLAVDVVIGHANVDGPLIEALTAGRPTFTVHRQLPTLAELMAKADLMLSAGGATTWERCCLGLPAIVAVVAENQKSATAALAERGVHYSLGDASTVSVADWTNAVRLLRNSPEQVRAYSAAALLVTDGGGVHRVAPILMHRNTWRQ